MSCSRILEDLRLINEVAITLDEDKFWRIVNQEYNGDYVAMMLDRYNCKINPKYPLVGKQGKFSIERDMMKAKKSNINKFLRDFDVRFKHWEIGKRHLIPDSDGYLVDIDADGKYDFKLDSDGKVVDDVLEDEFLTSELLDEFLKHLSDEGVNVSRITIREDKKPYGNSDKSFFVLMGFVSNTFEMVSRICKEVFGETRVRIGSGKITILKSSAYKGLKTRIADIDKIHAKLKAYDDRLSKKRTKAVKDITIKLPSYNSDGDVLIDKSFIKNLLGRLGYYGINIKDTTDGNSADTAYTGSIILTKEDKGIKGLLDLARKLEEVFGAECVEYDKLGFIAISKLVKSRKKAVGFKKR